MQLYIETALHELNIELVLCSTVSQAAAAFDGGPVGLLITDLMLPGESGIHLLERLRADGARYGGAKVVVVSAAIDGAGIPQRLAELGVWRMLRKPVALAELESCVTEALRTGKPAAMPRAPAEADGPPGDPAAAQGPRRQGRPDQPGGPVRRSAAITEFFGGDAALYGAFRSACLLQFTADVQHGDRCAQAPDLPALRRLAHSLKSVLRSLGEDDATVAAEGLEAGALEGDGLGAQRAWLGLRAHLLRLTEGD